MSPAPPSLPSPPPPPLDAGRKQSPATGSRSAGTVRDVIGVERRSQDTLEARASEMCLVCLAVQRRCDAVVHFAPQELRGGAVDWVGTFRYGGAAAAGSRVERENISIDERERIYRFPHVSCSCFMCQQEAEHTPLRHTSRGPAPAAPNSYTRASTRSVFHASLRQYRCMVVVGTPFLISRGGGP